MKLADFDNAVILVDKPAGRSSFDVISDLRRIIGVKKVGHCGTLDRFASGLLVVCTGKASRLARYFLESDKCYSGTIKLGTQTDTYDVTGSIVEQRPFGHVTEDMIRNTAKELLGHMDQKPPAYSSLKINGVRASDRVRRGEEVHLKSRNVTIYRFDITEVVLSEGEVSFEVECSKGTYIRSLAMDFGLRLGTVAYLKSLRRERSGNFRIEDAETLENIKISVDNPGSGSFLFKPLDALSDFGKVVVNAKAASKIVHGAFFDKSDILSLDMGRSRPFAIVDSSKNLIAVADIDIERWIIDYHIVFN